MTLSDFVNYAFYNRRGKAFENYTYRQIMYDVLRAARENVLCYAADGDEIVGLLLGYKTDDKTIHISHVLTTKEGVFWHLLENLWLVYTSARITAVRRGRTVEYNVPKFVERIKKHTGY